ncbi:hypothetical protein AMAG_11113 [Allomyces macrogynus ATCC 38327]|uniref:Nucleoside transporter n=1 Tax=Allomyces macrogynus (strain ATCC 38327) TaxID=578462 RepID=A0A0L0SSZ9_ALLM3|nr:hypothetical protein AMAG_11113 [Allomyces macrogynus ATCC 38327]|eukprot:KNE65495.1 hypothetical protein AMAG_11113 [Allomyces macrogynus ATCC 38327]
MDSMANGPASAGAGPVVDPYATASSTPASPAAPPAPSLVFHPNPTHPVIIGTPRRSSGYTIGSAGLAGTARARSTAGRTSRTHTIGSAAGMPTGGSPAHGDEQQRGVSKTLVAVFCLQGIGMLLPWNALISAPEFFASQFAAVPSIADTFSNAFAVVYMVADLLFTVFALVPMKKSTDRRLTITAFVVNALVFSAFLALACMSPDGGPHDPRDTFVLFGSILVGVFLSGASTAIVQMHLFALSSRAHAQFTSAMLVGQALSGVLVSTLHYVLTPSPEQVLSRGFISLQASTILYFGISVLVLAACLVFYLPLARAVRRHQTASSLTIWGAASADSLTSSRSDDDDETGAPDEEQTTLLTPVSGTFAAPPPLLLTRWELTRAIWPYVVATVWTFTVTLSVFPGLIVQMAPTGSIASGTVVAWGLIMFNVFDTIGRTTPDIAAWLRRPRRKVEPENDLLVDNDDNDVVLLLSDDAPRTVPHASKQHARNTLAQSLLRTMLIPAFIVLVPLRLPRHPMLPPAPEWGATPAAALTLVALLAGSSGYLATRALTAAPEIVVEVETVGPFGSARVERGLVDAEKGLVGRIMTLALLTGLTLGAIGSYAVLGAATAPA